MISESDSGWLYAGTEYGVFRSLDQGKRWISMNNGLVPVMIWSMCTDAEGRVFVGTAGRGVYMSTDRGEMWEIRTNGYDVQYSAALYASSRCGALFADGSGRGVYRSFDCGSTWQRVGSFSQVRSIYESSAGILYAGCFDTLFESSDCGETWSVTSAFTHCSEIFSILANNNGDLFLATRDGLLRSQDKGQHWTKSANVTPGIFGLRSLARNSKGTLFAGTDGVFRSTDEGASWQQTLAGVESAELAVDGNDCIYAATLTGVYRSTDAGDSWAEFNSGFVNHGGAVTVIAYDSVSGHVYAVQDSGGVARTINPAYIRISNGIALNHLPPAAFVLDQNYPNPFNPSTTIRYAVPHRSHVTLVVYNTLGQQVATLVNEDQEAGYREVKFDAQDLSSGVYFYRLKAADFVATKKLLILR
jgi:photosystem II stability/assembly factor-like uncharacterized protein